MELVAKSGPTFKGTERARALGGVEATLHL